MQNWLYSDSVARRNQAWIQVGFSHSWTDVESYTNPWPYDENMVAIAAKVLQSFASRVEGSEELTVMVWSGAASRFNSVLKPFLMLCRITGS